MCQTDGYPVTLSNTDSIFRTSAPSNLRALPLSKLFTVSAIPRTPSLASSNVPPHSSRQPLSITPIATLRDRDSLNPSYPPLIRRNSNGNLGNRRRGRELGCAPIQETKRSNKDALYLLPPPLAPTETLPVRSDVFALHAYANGEIYFQYVFSFSFHLLFFPPFLFTFDPYILPPSATPAYSSALNKHRQTEEKES